MKSHDCLSQAHHLLMVRRITPDRIVIHTSKSGITLQVATINTHTKAVVREKQKTWEGDVTLYLVASDKYEGWSYIVEWHDGNYFTCTCAENLSVSFCQDVLAVMDLLGMLA